MQEQSEVAVKMGFHLTFYIDEEKIEKWLKSAGFSVETINYQNYATHDITADLEQKDFIICIAKKSIDAKGFNLYSSIQSIKVFKKKQLIQFSYKSILTTKLLLLMILQQILFLDLINSYSLPGKIKYFKNQKSLGSPENWNESLRRASGEYIKMVHHDDWFVDENSLLEFVMLIEKDNVDFAFSASKVVFENVPNWIHSLSNEGFNELTQNPLILLTKNLIGGPSATIFKKKLNLFFDSNLKWFVDVEFYTRVLEVTKFCFTTEPLIVTFWRSG